ncbi:protein of unknown function [Paenibacillus alvei]|uniref:Uncharacterized protein n=1 Tax=Paenibacillus alvei TaxID=44250 RepID=A0A383RJT5_PAEAL|nr:protein of unknown function [Paenibacillus alvei]
MARRPRDKGEIAGGDREYVDAVQGLIVEIVASYRTTLFSVTAVNRVVYLLTWRMRC